MSDAEERIKKKIALTLASSAPPPSEVALRATAATRPAFSGAPLVVLFVYISI